MIVCKEHKRRVELIFEVRDIANLLGHAPTAYEYNQIINCRENRPWLPDSYPWWDPSRRCLLEFNVGCWGAFLAIADLEVPSADLLRAQVKALAEKLERTPTKKEFRDSPDTADISVVYCWYQKWNDFLSDAELEVNSEEVLVAQILELANVHGRTPTAEEFRNSKYVTSTMKDVYYTFGSWDAFLGAAGLEMLDIDRLPIIQVQEVAKALGHTPTKEEFCRAPGTMTLSDVHARFYYWNDLLRAAGLRVKNGKWTPSTK